MKILEEIKKGDHKALAKAITLIESNLEKDQEDARKLISKCLEHTTKSIRIGITGPPGVGKSTFIEAFGILLNNIGKKVAVLAIDPSSQKTKGSILGDKTRMKQLANKEHTFIRPSPANDILGGIARRTRESIILCETAGFDIIIIETVGVGQSEGSVADVVDFCLLLTLTGAGDSLQAIKRGVIESADALIITKADGDNILKAKQLSIEYKNSLTLFKKENGWQTKIGICSALEKTGLKSIWEYILSHNNQMIENKYFLKNRKQQELKYLNNLIQEEIGKRRYFELKNNGSLKKIEEDFLEENKNTYQIIQELIRTTL